MDVPVARRDSSIELPGYARDGDAGLDLRAQHDLTLAAVGGRGAVGTGLVMALPEGTCGLVLPRSGLAVRHGVTVVNAPGLIDAGYRGEIVVALINTDPVSDYVVRRGDRIAQLLIIGFTAIRWTEVAEADLPTSAGEAHRQRGSGGFGHSG